MLRRATKAPNEGGDADVEDLTKESPRGLSRGLRLYLLCAILAVAAVSTFALFTLAPNYFPGSGSKLAVVGKKGGSMSGSKGGGSGKGKSGGKPTPSTTSAPQMVIDSVLHPTKPPRGKGKGKPSKAAAAAPAPAAPVDNELEDRPPVFSDAELGLSGDADSAASGEPAGDDKSGGRSRAGAGGDAGNSNDSSSGGGGASDALVGGGDDEEGPSEFSHDNDPIPPTQHDEVHRPFGGRGCTFKACNAEKGAYIVSGRVADTLPMMYVVVPHRNRVDNIVRLLTSLNNATTPAQRACMCILLTDFNTTTAVIPPWKNVHCLVSFRHRHGIYMDDESFTPPRELRKGDLKKVAVSYAHPQPCPEVTDFDRQALRTPAYGSWGSVTDHFPPAHLDVSGLTGRQAVRHALAFFDGESAILDGNKYVKDVRVKFSRAGGIMAGVDAIQSDPERSLVFICDADMIIRRGVVEDALGAQLRGNGDPMLRGLPPGSTTVKAQGFVEDMVRVPTPGRGVFLPIIWSMCWGAALEDGPRRSNWRSSRKGFWRPGGRGMVIAYLSDIKAVGGMRDMVRRKVWGQEDDRFYAKLSRKFNVTRFAAPYLLHFYHSRVKDWSKSDDGISMGPTIGPLGKHVCIPSGTCTCPPGTSPKQVAAVIQEELNITVRIL